VRTFYCAPLLLVPRDNAPRIGHKGNGDIAHTIKTGGRLVMAPKVFPSVRLINDDGLCSAVDIPQLIVPHNAYAIVRARCGVHSIVLRYWSCSPPPPRDLEPVAGYAVVLPFFLNADV
jgi:hypothetical protein